MSVILYFLFFLVLIFLIFFFSIGMSILRLFGKGKRYARHQSSGKNGQRRNNTSGKAAGQGQNKKIFSKDEGEYVDFEEIE